jgi:NAD(P)-dependent dehydrogenase (short-subunit alcohol dehydrogenase family)
VGAPGAALMPVSSRTRNFSLFPAWIPSGRFGKADEVARAVMMLLDNSYMTGQTVAMSGGMAHN